MPRDGYQPSSGRYITHTPKSPAGRHDDNKISGSDQTTRMRAELVLRPWESNHGRQIHSTVFVSSRFDTDDTLVNPGLSQSESHSASLRTSIRSSPALFDPERSSSFDHSDYLDKSDFEQEEDHHLSRNHRSNIYPEVEYHSRPSRLSDNITSEPEFDFIEDARVSKRSPVFRTPSPPSHPCSSFSPASMHVSTPSISRQLDGFYASDISQFDKIEDEDQFSYSDYENGNGSMEQQVEFEDAENDHDDGDRHKNERVWFAGSGRDEWCKMKADVEEQLREAERIAEEDYRERSMCLDGGSDAAATDDDTELVQKSKSASQEDEVAAGLFGEDVAMEELGVDKPENNIGLVDYGELLISTIQRLAAAEGHERTQLEIERSNIINMMMLTRAKVEGGKGKEEADNSPELTAAIALPLTGQESDIRDGDSKRKDLTAEATWKRKRDEGTHDGRHRGAKSDAAAVNNGVPKPKRQRRTAKQIAADKEQKLKDKEAKATAQAAKKAEQEAKAAAKKAEQEAQKAAREAEKQRLKDEKAAEKAKNKTPAQLAAEARKEAQGRDKVEKARGLLGGKPKSVPSWKKKAPGEGSRWKTREEQAAIEQAAAAAEQVE